MCRTVGASRLAWLWRQVPIAMNLGAQRSGPNCTPRAADETDRRTPERYREMGFSAALTRSTNSEQAYDGSIPLPFEFVPKMVQFRHALVRT